MSRYAKPMSQVLAEMQEAKKITKKERDKLEDDNQHGELALRLAQSFGTPQEVKKIKDINKRHMQKGSIDPKDQAERDKISNKYYKMAEGLEEGYESEVLKVLDDAGIDGYFRNGKLYVDKRDANAAKSALEDADNIMKLPKMVKEEVEDLDEMFDYVLLDKDNKIAGRYSGKNAKKEAESGKKSAHLPPMSIPKAEVSKMKIVPISPKDKKDIGDMVLAIGEALDPADIDLDATDADKKAADKNMVMQMRKALDVKGNMKIEFGDGKKEKVDPKILQMMVTAHGKIQKPRDKEKFVAMISKSKRDMLMVAKKLSTLKMELDKEDEPIVKKVVQMLKKASGAHASQAKDLDKAIKETLEIKEGTWKMPDNPKEIAALKKLMSRPLPIGNTEDDDKYKDSASSKLYSLLGDDELFDALGALEDKGKEKADARPVIIKWFQKRAKDNSYDLGDRTKDLGKQIGLKMEYIPEGFSPKEIKMAIGIASDPRYKQGNYTGAFKAIEKIKKGLASHPQVAAVLKRQNENLNEAEFKINYSKDGKNFEKIIKAKSEDDAEKQALRKFKIDSKDISQLEQTKTTRIKMGDMSKIFDLLKAGDEIKIIPGNFPSHRRNPKSGSDYVNYRVQKDSDESSGTVELQPLGDVLGGFANVTLVKKGNKVTYKSNGKDVGLPYAIKFVDRFSNKLKVYEELDEAKFSNDMIDKLRKAYEPLKGKKINPTPLMKIFDKIDSNKDGLIQLYKANIPFVSTMAMSRLTLKHNMKADEVKKLREEVELDEKYDLYHKSFSDAMQHAYDYAKKKLGITVDPKEIDNKVATGPKKPSEGKTNIYRLKGKGGNLQIQVYNKGGSKPFELNMYKEENDMTKSLKDTIVEMWTEASEGFASDAQRKAAFAQGYKAKGKKKDKDEGNEFTGALKAAREKGEKTFVVGGKTYDVKDEEKKLDKVNPDAVKKKFDDRKDKDIDNDGDVDSTDKYLHKRRKAISKAVKSEEVELDENYRKLAMKGIGTETKKGAKVGLKTDYYLPKNGDKSFGKITRVSSNGYEITDEKTKKVYKFKFYDADNDPTSVRGTREEVTESFERYHETKQGSLRDAILQMWGEGITRGTGKKGLEKSLDKLYGPKKGSKKEDLTKEKKDGIKKMTDTGKEVTPVETSVKMPKIKEAKNKV